MSGMSDFLSNLGFGTSSATKSAQGNEAGAIDAYQGLTPPSLSAETPSYGAASQEGPTALNGVAVNPEDESAQESQMAALSNLANNGGRNAAMTQNLAQIQQGQNANAAGQRGAVMQNAASRGMGGSGTELLGELAANQNAQSNQNAQDLGVAANAQNTALNAGMGAAQIGSNLEAQDYGQQANKAQAQDAISRFNSGQNTGVSEYNAGVGNQAQQYNTGLQEQDYQNQYGKAQGLANANMGSANFNQAQANMGAQQAGNLVGGAVKLGTAAFAARGGEVPGSPALPGVDSTMNDTVSAGNSGGPNIRVSPHEVVVPISLRQKGTPAQITNFVRHPPKIPAVPGSNSDHEAMLSALGNIRRRRAI